MFGLIGIDLLNAEIETSLPCDVCGEAGGIEKWTCQSCKITICPKCEKDIMPREKGCPVCNNCLRGVAYSAVYSMPTNDALKFLFKSKARTGFEPLRQKYIEDRGWGLSE